MASVTLPSLTDAVRTRLGRTTRRERALLAAVGVAGLAALPFLAHDWADRRRADALADAARLQALTAADDAGRLRAVSARVAALEARVRGWAPPAPSFAVARVQVEQEVALAASQARLTTLDVRSAETPDRIGGLPFVRVEVESAFSWPGLAELMRRLATGRPGVLVERAAREGEGPDARLRLVLLAPFRTEGRA